MFASTTSLRGSATSLRANSATRSVAHFPLERDLVDRFAPLVPAVLGSACESEYRREVEIGARIADIVAWSEPNHAPHFAGAALRRARIGDLAILAHLLERPLSTQTLAARTHAEVELVRLRLAALQRWGLVATHGDTYSIGGWGASLPTQVLAVEAKLSDWRAAVEQGAYYSQFVDLAWVLLPAGTPGTDDAAAACRAAGLGLVLFDGERVEKRVRPRRRVGGAYFRRLLRLRLAWNNARSAHE